MSSYFSHLRATNNFSLFSCLGLHKITPKVLGYIDLKNLNIILPSSLLIEEPKGQLKNIHSQMGLIGDPYQELLRNNFRLKCTFKIATGCQKSAVAVQAGLWKHGWIQGFLSTRTHKDVLEHVWLIASTVL